MFLKKIKAHPILDSEFELPVATPQIEVEEVEDDEDEPSSIETLLQIALVGEYQQWDLYTSYASRLKGHSRQSIADEFKAHADEETAHIELIQRYLVSMGAVPTLNRKPLPELTNNATIKDIVLLQLQFENDAVSLYQKILAVLPDNEALKLDIEGVLVKEQEHVHDLELLLKQQEVVSGLMFRPVEPGEPTKPQAGYGTGCGCGDSQCSLPFLQKVDQAWCINALKELSSDLYARWYQRKLFTPEEKEFIAQAIALKSQLKDKRAILRLLDF